MQNILVNKRQLLWNERRKKQNQKTFNEKRAKFLDMTDLLIQTQQLEKKNNHYSNPTNSPLYQKNIISKDITKKAEQSNIKIYDSNVLYNKYSIQYWLKNSKTDNLLLKQIYLKQFLGIIIKISGFSDEAIQNILQIFHNFIMYEPVLQLQSRKECIEKIQIIICSIRLKQEAFYLAMECISKFVKDDDIKLLCKNKQFISALIGYYLVELQDQKNLEKIINILNKIFSGNDQNTKQLFFQNLNFLNIIHKNLNQYSPKMLALALDTLTNLVLIGPDIISFVFEFNIIESLCEIFNLAPIVIKEKIIIIFHNMMIVASDQQKIKFCQKNTLIILLFCIENKFSLNSVHLSLKILTKVVKLASKFQSKFIYFWNFIKSYFCQTYNLKRKLGNLIQYYQDQFIHEESLTLIELLKEKLVDSMDEQIQNNLYG